MAQGGFAGRSRREGPPPGASRPGIRRLLAALAALAAGAALTAAAGCGSAPATSGAAAALGGTKPLRPAKMTAVTVLVGTPVVDVSYAPYLVAQALGYFARENLQVTIQPSTGSTDAIKQAALGHVQFAHITPEPVMIGLQPGRGLRSRVVYTVVQRAIFSLRVPAGSPIRTVADLRGKAIGVVNLASAAVDDIRALVKQAGLNPATDVHVVATGLGASALAALRSHQVDALDMTDTQFAVLRNMGLRLRTIPTPLLDRFPSAGLVVSDAFLRQHPDVIAAFGRAVAEGTAFTEANPKAAVLACWKAKPGLRPAGVPEAKALSQQLAVLGARLPRLRLPPAARGDYGYSDPAAYAAYANYLKQQGVLAQAIDPTQVYTNEFVKQYNLFDAGAIQKQADAYRG